MDPHLKASHSKRVQIAKENASFLIRGSVCLSRRSVTESEEERALQAAEALELVNPNILLVMSVGTRISRMVD